MADALKTFATRADKTSTPQSQAADSRQVKNAAGGYTFSVSDMDAVKRFLILGSETNFYTSGAELTASNAKTIIGLASDPRTSKTLVDLIVEISTAGRAPKQNPALFALAIAASHGDVDSKKYALSKLNEVARIATHLFLFAGYIEQFRGWGPALRKAVADWYTSKDVDKVTYQAVKYQSREGYTHRDLFRLSHPVSGDVAFHGLGEWILRGDTASAPRLVQGFTAAKAPGANVPALVKDYGLTWEMVPTEALNEPATWASLLDGNVPLGALLRQLPRLTRIGVLAPMSTVTDSVVARLTDKDEILRSRIHPINVLIALKTYSSGKSERGSSTWTPIRQVTDALDTMFYQAFKNVNPAGKRTLIALDVSGSMGGTYGFDGGLPGGLSPREATAAIALVTAATEPKVHTIGFTGGSRGWGFGARHASSAGAGRYAAAVTDLDSAVSPRRRLDDVVRDISGLPFGSTDCSLPMLYALEKGLEIDTFSVYTDNETWAGDMHPHEALAKYRKATGIDAKVVVLSTVASRNTIMDPNDPNCLDIAGFDSAVPGLIADFSRGL